MQLEHHPLPTLSMSGDGLLLGANGPACSMTGLQPDAVQGMVIERVLQPVENGPPLERFLGDLLTRGQGRFDGLLLGGERKHRVTAWGWRPSPTEQAFWVHLVPAPPPRTNPPAAPAAPAPAAPALPHLSPSFRSVLSSPQKVDQLMRLGASAGVLARELLADLMNLSPGVREHPELRTSMASLVKVAIALSEHAERVSELTGTAGELIPEVVPLQRVLEAVRVLMEGVIPEDIHVHVEMEEGTPDPFCHAMALEQTLLALCANARDAMPAGGHIIISAQAGQDSGRMLIRVRDTGAGMRAEDVDSAFGPHYGSRGMGLGLPLVRELMQRMDGTISLESTTTVGTTVTLNLPAVEREVVPQGRPHVLLVEDNAQLARVTGRLLEQSGMSVTHVPDGAEALQLLATGAHLAAILLDLNLPRATGRDVLQFVQVMPNPAPVVVFTSEDVGTVEEELKSLGAFAVLGKPFRGQELVELLRSAMRGGR